MARTGRTGDSDTANGAAGSRRDRILAAAIEVFAREGFRGATTRVIAEAAGVTDALLFYHFRTKSDLYLAAVQDQLEKLRQGLGQALAQRTNMDPAARLESFVTVYLHYFIDLEPGLSVTLRELNGVPLAVATQISVTHHRAVIKRLEEILSAGVAAGSFRQLNVPACAMAIIGILQIFIRARAAGNTRYSRADAIAQVMEYYRPGLLTADTAPRPSLGENEGRVEVESGVPSRPV